jgi:hypothetical protein
MLVKRKKPCLAPSGCKADLTRGDDARLKAARFSIVEIRVGNDDDLVARHR